MDSKNFTIGVLATTAVIMLTGILVVHSSNQPAYASGMGAQGGDYILTTGQFKNNEELVYVIDSSKGLMLTYRYDTRNQALILSGPPLDIRQLRPEEGGGKNRKP